ncbi:toprim domain-containing protein [Plantactinospora sp. WMMB782]|uniref:toprim domain-containing protein n=1 Tax=Plantactinospora sp. WMMB782 TaxID=3404121 RepID=UPI003B945DD1
MADDKEPLRPLSPAQRKALEEAVACYQETATPEVGEWLEARGITPELADEFRLGVVVDPMPGHGKFRGYLAIPYLDHNGAPLTIRFRCLEEHVHRDHYHGKYMSVEDEPVRMFNIGAIHRAGDTIHVAEGELDAIILNAMGLPAVGAPGVESWAGRHRRMLAGFSKVWVWADPDDAGAKLTSKITRSLRSAQAVSLRQEHGDVTDLYVAGGPAALLELIEERG